MKLMIAIAAALGAASLAHAQTQGVSKNEIVVGTAQDLSGPVVPFSKPAVNGMLMRIDEINGNGGIHGRKLKLVVEDHGYDPKKAVLAAQKLIQKDRIFAVLGPIGTPTAMAGMPIYLEKNVPHLFPLSAARQMFEPLHKLKYSFAATYYEGIRAGLKRLVKEKGLKRVCTLYQDDDFGLEVMQGGEAALKELGMSYAERTTYKRVRPTSLRRCRRCRARDATWWCWARSSAKPSAPSPPRVNSAGTPSSSALPRSIST